MKHSNKSVINALVFLFGITFLLMSCAKTNKKQIGTSLDVSDSSSTEIETSLTPKTNSVDDGDTTSIIEAAELEKESEAAPSKIEKSTQNEAQPAKTSEAKKELTEESLKETVDNSTEDEIIETPPTPVENEIIEAVTEEETTPDEVIIIETPKEQEAEVIVDEVVEAENEKETKTLNDDWPVPTKYKNLKNPMEADEESLKIGKMLYNKHCASCHGKTGLGDGKKADELDTDSGDFTLNKYQGQSDGSLFYKTWEGRDEMPGYKKKIPDEEDIWHIVNYTRTFK